MINRRAHAVNWTAPLAVRRVDAGRKCSTSSVLVEQDVEVDEITIPSPDFPGGQTFGPVTIDGRWDGPVDASRELPVTFAVHHCRRFGIGWYPQRCRTRGIFTVVADRISLTLTAPMVVERAAWWRRLGFWLLSRSRGSRLRRADVRARLSRR